METLIATGVFVLIAIALSGVWVLYGRGLAKSGEHLAANSLARSTSEGLLAKGWDFLDSQDPAPRTATGTVHTLPNPFIVERQVRGRQADIHFQISYEVIMNTPDSSGVQRVFPNLTRDLCRLTVTIRWSSNVGGTTGSQDLNNQVTYTSMIYKEAIE